MSIIPLVLTIKSFTSVKSVFSLAGVEDQFALKFLRKMSYEWLVFKSN